MTQSPEQLDVYIETGKRRTFAGVIEWPGWCRSGRDEEAALQTLVEYGPRYASALQSTPLGFQAPADVSPFHVVERLEGNVATDFGALGAIPAADARPLDDAELQRLRTVLEACWLAFDAAVEMAAGTELRKGPRGGGRELDEIIRHVIDADAAYLRRLGHKYRQEDNAAGDDAVADELGLIRPAILDGLAAAARGELPERGPRGGARWSPRYFVRRSTWHVLDHAWEIEDRIT